jgi:hypothetical protein
MAAIFVQTLSSLEGRFHEFHMICIRLGIKKSQNKTGIQQKCDYLML